MNRIQGALDYSTFLVLKGRYGDVPTEKVKELNRICNHVHYSCHGGIQQNFLYAAVLAYSLGVCDGKRAERERRHSRNMGCCVFNGRSTK